MTHDYKFLRIYKFIVAYYINMPESHYYDNDTFTTFLKDISGNTSIIYKYDASYSPLAAAGTDYHTNTDLSYVQFNNQIFSIADDIITHGIGKITDISYSTGFMESLKYFPFDISGVSFIGNYSEQGGVYGTNDASMTAVFDLFQYIQNGYTLTPINSGITYNGASLDTHQLLPTYQIWSSDVNGDYQNDIIYKSDNIVDIILYKLNASHEWEVVSIDENLNYNEPVKYYEYSRIHSYDYPDLSGNINNIVINRGEYQNPKQITDELRITTIIISTFTYTNISLTSTKETILTSSSYSSNGTLQTINIGTAVTSIANNAFENSSSLIDITFDANSKMATIGNTAFKNCSSLVGTLIVPASLTSIGENAFQLCTNLTAIDFELDSMIDNGGAGTIGSNAFVDSGITTFNAYNTTITANTWSTSPQTIGGKNITINNLSQHTKYTYNDNTTSSHVDTTLSNSNNNNILTIIVIGPQVTSISNDAFKDSATLTSITFDSDIQLPTISTNAFKNSGLNGAITLPGSLTGIGVSAFHSCTDITSVNFNLLGQLATIGVSAFEGCSSLNGTFPLPDSLTSLGASAFKSCSSMTTVSFSSNLTTISDSTFQSSGLNGAITLPTTVTSIGSSAFQSCSNMTSVNFNELTQLTTISVSAFENSGLDGVVTLPASLTSIGENAFLQCSDIISITFEDGSLTSGGAGDISGNAFDGCTSLTTINAYSSTINIMNWSTGENQSFYGSTVTINNLSSVTEHTTFTYNNQAPTTTNDVTLSGFAYNTALTSIEIGQAVREIGTDAFESCSALTTLTFVSGSQLETIGDDAFRRSGLVGNIIIPASVIFIAGDAFEECDELTDITFEVNSQLQTIGVESFKASGINIGINLPTSIITISGRAFANIPILSVNFRELTQLELIGIGAFSGCNNLKMSSKFNEESTLGIVLPASLKNLENSAFFGCNSITAVTFEQGSLVGGNYGNFVFGECTSLTTISAYQDTLTVMNLSPGAQTIDDIQITINLLT
jgi:hypothetical protein